MQGEPLSQWVDADFADAMRSVGYQVQERIGGTETADIFLACQTSLDCQVALKTMLPQLAADPVLKKRFIEVSRAVAAVGHVHIIPIYDVGEVRGTVYLASRYLPAGDVGSLVRRLASAGSQLPVHRAAEIVRQAASALDAAHAARLVHRDVRPASMLLEADSDARAADHVYLSDFGLSQRSLQAVGSGGVAFDGTVGYVAPEQLAGRPAASSDQYSLGCSAFELLTGRAPFRDAASHLAGARALVTSLRRGLDREVDVVFAKVLALDPAERYRDCGEFAAHLAAALAVQPTAAPDAQRGIVWQFDPPWGFDPDPALGRAQPARAQQPASAGYATGVQEPGDAMAGRGLEPPPARPVVPLGTEQLDLPEPDSPRRDGRRPARGRWRRAAAGLLGGLTISLAVLPILATVRGLEPGAAPPSPARVTPSSARAPAASPAPASPAPGTTRHVLPPPAMEPPAHHPIRAPASPAPQPSRPAPTPTERPGSGYTKLYVLLSGNYLDVYQQATYVHAWLAVWRNINNRGEEFSYPNRNGQVGEIRSESSGMCVTTDGKAGSTLFLTPCKNAAGQRWKADIWKTSSEPGKTMVTFVNPSSGLSMNVSGNVDAAGTAVIGWHQYRGSNEAFVLPG